MKNQFLQKSLFTGFILLLFTGSWAQLSIPDVNPVTINFTGFDASGFVPTPAAGQLNSNEWIVTGFSDGDMIFGDEKNTGDFARGTSTGGVTTGGVFAFDVGSGNVTLGVQPGGTDWTPGSFILRIQNNTGDIIGRLDVSYSIFVLNDQGRGNSFNFSHSPNNVTYINESSVNYTSPDAADGTPAWTEVTRNISLIGINIDPGEFYYLSWNGDDVSGSGSRDEFGLDNVSITATLGRIDITPPVFNPNTPRTSDIRLTQFDIVVNLDEIGTVYYLVKNNDDPAPTKSEVMGGNSIDVFTANADFSTTISGLTQGTDYDVYFLAEDKEPVPNVQDTTTLLEVRTQVPRALDLIVPVGGETFYVGDTTIIRWTSDGIDSLQLWAYDFEELVWHAVLGDEEAKIYAEQDSLVLPIPRSAGLDSTYFRLSDANDFSFFDSCGVFYLTDTIKPLLIGTLPANHQTNVSQLDTLVVGFDEGVFPNNGLFVVKRKSDDSIFDSIRIIEENLNLYWQFIVVKLNRMLESGTEYYVNITPGSFIDYQDNAFAGILDDTTWTFTTIGQDLFISEYLEGSSNNKALEIANTTGSDVDLSQYEIWRANSTGGVVDWNVVSKYSLSGTLPNNSVYVICNANAMDSIKVRSDVVGGALDGVTYYNGDDAVAIAKNIEGNWVLIDAVGIEGPDPGTAWSVAGVANATAEHTLLRKSYINQGSIDWTVTAGTNAFNSEWKVFPQNYYENLGLMTPPEDTLAEIVSFTLNEETGLAIIDSAAATVDLVVVMGTKLDSLFPVIVVSPGAGVQPASEDSVDFSNGPVLFTVTAEDHVHTKVWTVTVTEEIIPSSENDILSFTLLEQTGNAVIDVVHFVVSAEVKYGTSLVSLTPTITISAAATIDPVSGVARDFSDTVTYTVTAQDGTPQVWKVSVKVQQPVEVASIAELRAGLRDGTLYKLTGEGIVIAKFVFSNTKYIQDAAAGIQVYDPAGIITTTYDIGDGITGIIGTLQEYNGMLEFTPKVDPGAASSTGNEITPIEITVGEFRTNRESYESRLIKFTKVKFLDAGSTFANGHGYKLVQGNDTTTFYTQYYDLDYKDQVIPELADITALGYEYKGTPEIIARFAADIVEVILSSEKDILTFVLSQQTGDAVINATAHTVDIEVNAGTNVTALEPVITVSEGANVAPLSGESVDFTTPVVYTVSAEDGSEQDWTVTVTVATFIPENFLSGNVRIWPNPNNGKFNISVTTGQITDIRLQILDVDGRMVFNKDYTSVNSIDEMTDTGISEPGVYFVRIMSGQSIWTGKLIIQ
jgi:hypothetical protein